MAIDDVFSRLYGPPRRRTPNFSLTPEQEASLISRVGGPALSGLGMVGNVLDLPTSSVRDFLGGQNPWDQWATPFSSENRLAGRDLLRQGGFVGPQDTWGNFAAGLGVEIALDPLTYLTFGGSALGKAGQAAKKADVLADVLRAGKKGAFGGAKMGPRETRMTATLGDYLGTLSPEAATTATEKLSRAAGGNLTPLLDQPLGGNVGLALPFMEPFATANLPFGRQLAQGMDYLGDKVRYGKYSPVPPLAQLFDRSLMGAMGGKSQRVAKDVNQPLVEQGQAHARDFIYGLAKQIDEAGTLDLGQVENRLRTKPVDSPERTRWQQQVTEVFGESPEAQAMMAHHDTVAKLWASAQKKKPEDWYVERLDEVNRMRYQDVPQHIQQSALFHPAWHGSPHRFEPEIEIETPEGVLFSGPLKELPKEIADAVHSGQYVVRNYDKGRFRLDKLGTGEGNQAYGWGLYFADSEDVANVYKDLADNRVIKANFRGKDVTDHGGAYDQYESTIFDIAEDMSNGRSLSDIKTDLLRMAEIMLEPVDKQAGDLVLDAATPERTKWYSEYIDFIKSLKESDFDFEFAKGAKYRVELAPKPDEYLLLDEPMAKQSDKVRKALGIDVDSDTVEFYRTRINNLNAQIERLDNAGRTEEANALASQYENLIDEIRGQGIVLRSNPDGSPRFPQVDQTGLEVYEKLAGELGSAKEASQWLHKRGVRGNKYFDGFSRRKGEGNYNYVIFDDKDVEIQDVLFQGGRKPRYQVKPVSVGDDKKAPATVFGQTPTNVYRVGNKSMGRVGYIAEMPDGKIYSVVSSTDVNPQYLAKHNATPYDTIADDMLLSDEPITDGTQMGPVIPAASIEEAFQHFDRAVGQTDIVLPKSGKEIFRAPKSNAIDPDSLFEGNSQSWLLGKSKVVFDADTEDMRRARLFGAVNHDQKVVSLQSSTSAVDEATVNRAATALQQKYPDYELVDYTKRTPHRLLQSGISDPRGMVQFDPNTGKALITAFEAADVTTFVHESGHVFRRALKEVDKELWRKANQAIGVSDGNNWTRAEEEVFAEEFEKYLATGKAKTPEMRTLFQRFKEWIVGVYQKLVGTPAAQNINPQLKEVFDDLLGSDRQLKKQAHAEVVDRGNQMIRYLEGVDSQWTGDPNLQQPLDEAKTKLDEQLQREKDAGLKIEALDDILPQYFPAMRQFFPGGRKFRANSRAYGATHGFAKRREEIFRNVPGGRATINEMSIDPDISGLAWTTGKKDGKLKKSDIDYIVGMLERNYNVDPASESLRDLAEWVGKLDPRHAQERIPAFESNPLNALAKRLEDGERAIAGAETIKSVLKETAAPDGDVSITDVLRDSKLDTDAAKDDIANALGVSKNDLKNMRVPAEVAGDFKRMIDSYKSPQELAPVIDIYDRFTRAFKSSVTSLFPAFHTRNAVSALYQNYVGGAASPYGYENAVRIMLKQPTQGLSDIPLVKGLSEEEAQDKIIREAFKHGVVGHRQGYLNETAEDMLRSPFSGVPGVGPMWSPPPAGTTPLQRMNPFETLSGSTTFTPERIAQDVGGKIEQMNRLAPFIELLRQGYDPAAAARKVKLLQVDYSSLAPFERQVMRRLFPFYSFTSRMMPMVLEELIERPGGRMGRTITTAGRQRNPDEITPDYVAETASIPLGTLPDGSKRYLTGFGLPFEDPLSFLGGGTRGALLEAASRMNPIPKGIAEWTTGQSFFQKGPAGGRPIEDLDPTLGRTVANIRELVTGEETRFAPPLGTSILGRDRAQGLEFLVSNSPLTRFASTARTVTDPRKWENPLTGVLPNVTTGVRVSDISPAAQESLLRERSAEALKRLGARDFVVTNISDEDIAKLPPEQQLEAIRLKALRRVLQRRISERNAAAR